MKKIISFILALTMVLGIMAEETILLKSDAVADLDGYDYVSNFEIKSDSGNFKKDDLLILQPNEKGFRFMAKNVPISMPCNYKILPSYPSFLNETGIGAGYIENAGSIKSIKVTATTNRPYDEIYVLYSTSPNGPVKEIKMPQDFNSIHSMEEFTLVWENPAYISDVTKRDLTDKPVLGPNAEGIYFRGIKVQTNTPTGFGAYSEYSVFYLKEVSVIYDKMFTDEQMENKKILKEEFGINENNDLEVKTKALIKEKNRIKENEKALME